jgi:Lamin Tail Domain/Secretion system C-terminal sorting domain
VFRDACVISGCDAGEVFTEDGQIFQTVCIGAIETTILPQNNGQSIDDSYTYFLTDANDNIIQELDGSWTCNDAAEGTYHIYGVSFVGNLDALTTAAGSPINGIMSDSCAEVTNNFIEVIVVICDGPSPCTELFFSEILEDSQSNKAIEIYNPTPFAIDLAGYTVNMYSNGSTVPTEVLNCAGTIAPYEVYVVVSSGNGQNPTDQIILDQADTLHTVSTFSGNDALELTYGGSTLDIIGIIGDDPGQFGWQFGNSSTSNQVLVRRPEVTMPNSDWNIASGQWISYDPTDYSHLGSHAAADCGNSEIATIGFTTDAQLITENTALVTVSIDYNNPGSEFNIIVDAAGSATNGNDYNATFPLELTIPIGNGTLSFDISIFGDGLVEGDETIDLSISTSTNILYSNQNTIITIQDFVGIAENELSKIKVYPNPCADQLQVSSEENINSIRICDMSGRVVLNKNYGEINSIKLDLASLSAGQYVLEIKTLNTVSRNTLSVIK